MQSNSKNIPFVTVWHAVHPIYIYGGTAKTPSYTTTDKYGLKNGLGAERTQNNVNTTQFTHT